MPSSFPQQQITCTKARSSRAPPAYLIRVTCCSHGRVAFMRQAFCLSRRLGFQLPRFVSFLTQLSTHRNNHSHTPPPIHTQCRNQSPSPSPPPMTAAPSVPPSVAPSLPSLLKPLPSAPCLPNPTAKFSSQEAPDQRLYPHHPRSSPMSRVRLLVPGPASSMSTKQREGEKTSESG